MERQIAVRVTHIVDADERETVRQSVHCPKEAGTLELDACQRCPFHKGAQLGDDERGARVRCAFAAAEASETFGVAGPPVEQVMTRTPICVRQDVPTEVLLSLFVERGISGAPVVNERGCAIGMVTLTDLAKERYEQMESADGFAGAILGGKRLGLRLVPEALPRRTAQELMTAHLVVIPEGRPVAEAAALMARHRIKRVPVVDAQERITGILSSLDIMRWAGALAGFAVD